MRHKLQFLRRCRNTHRSRVCHKIPPGAITRTPILGPQLRALCARPIRRQPGNHSPFVRRTPIGPHWTRQRLGHDGRPHGHRDPMSIERRRVRRPRQSRRPRAKHGRSQGSTPRRRPPMPRRQPPRWPVQFPRRGHPSSPRARSGRPRQLGRQTPCCGESHRHTARSVDHQGRTRTFHRVAGGSGGATRHHRADGVVGQSRGGHRIHSHSGRSHDQP